MIACGAAHTAGWGPTAPHLAYVITTSAWLITRLELSDLLYGTISALISHYLQHISLLAHIR